MEGSGPNVGRRELLQALGAAGVVGLAGCSGGGDGGDGGSDGGDGGSDGAEGSGGDGDGDGDGGGTDAGSTDGGDGDGGEQDTVRAAWAYLTQPGDQGWTREHDRAVQAVDEKFDWLEVSTTNQVPNEDVGAVMRQYAEEGQDICFGSSFGYMDPMYETATEYEDTLFEHCAGFRQRENMGRYFAHMDQTYFLAGIAAGMVSETDTLGFLAPFPIAEVVRFINAFAIGASFNNDDASVKLRWMNTWFDPPKAKQGAESLMDVDCDVITGAMDSPATVEAAASGGAWSIGANSPMAEFGGDRYITSVVYNWEPFYTETLESVRDGTWESDFYWGHIGDDAVRLDDWGPQIPADVTDAVGAEKQALIDGDRTIWTGTRFEGESDSFLFEEMNTLVPQVESELP
jgi:basic membrane protein A